MTTRLMKAERCPTDKLSLTNCAVINEKEPQFEQHVTVRNLTRKYVFTLKTHPSVNMGSIAFSLPQHTEKMGRSIHRTRGGSLQLHV